jgi:hypothetical protein
MRTKMEWEWKKLSDPLKRGVFVTFYGSEKDKPCGCQFHSKDDLGRNVFCDFEVFACDDIVIKTGSRAPPTYTPIVPGITAKELIENLKLCFKRCGCKTD